MCHFAQADEALKEDVKSLLTFEVKHSSPSVTSRAKILQGKFYKLF